MSKIILPAKYQGETILAQFSFLSRVSVGITLSSPTVTATVYSGTDVNPSSIISGSATVSGSTINQKITAGVVGVTYLLKCTASTSDGQTLQQTALLSILPDAT